MAHTHDMYDMENHFEINGSSRFIRELSATKLVVVQGDHRSEIITFKMPRFIDGHDMTLCNRIRVHFNNVDTATNDKSDDIYDVTDLKVCEDDENMLTFTWEIEAVATKYAGTLVFSVKFQCVEGDNILYEWNTAKYVGTNVLAGINNSEEFVEKYSNVLEQWHNELTKGADSIEEMTEQALKDIETAKEMAIAEVSNKDYYYWKTFKYSGEDKTFVYDENVISDNTYKNGDSFTFRFLAKDKDLVEIVYVDQDGEESYPLWLPSGNEYEEIHLDYVKLYSQIRVNSYVDVEHWAKAGTVQDLKNELENLKLNDPSSPCGDGKTTVIMGGLDDAEVKDELYIYPLTKEEYENEYKNGNVKQDAFYLTPEDDYVPTAKVEQTSEGAKITLSDSEGVTSVTVKNGDNGKSAYEYAKEKGYAGTEEDFANQMYVVASIVDGNGVAY